MKILITGVAGFIGSNLAAALLERGHQIVGVDNMSQGHPLNLAACVTSPSFQLHQVDVRDRPALAAVAAGVDVIVHLAAYKIPRYTDALDTLVINGEGSRNVAEVAREVNAKLVAASTSDVYGKNPGVPFSEDADLVVGGPTVRRWAYAVSKMYEEQLLFAYRERYGLKVVVIRLFGGYGPHQNLTWWGGPQSVFINAALDGERLEVHGDGSQTRSFTYVSDHVDGISRCIAQEAADGLVVNLGSVEEISIVRLAERIWRIVRPQDEPRIQLVPYSTFGKYEDVRRRVPDIERARTVLGFEPKIDLATGLKRTIHWQVKRRRELGIPTMDFSE